jgi:hypothetical protein
MISNDSLKALQQSAPTFGRKRAESKDDFEIVTEEESGLTKDRELLVAQMQGLFNSQPIKIEEKGYLIQLMHNFDMRQTMVGILSDVNQAR